MPRHARAFTLVELLVVISIIVILVAILVPSLEKAMAASQKSKCLANLSGIGKGLATSLNDSLARVYMSSASPWALFGKRGEPYNNGGNSHTQDVYNSDKRPLNKYLGITGKDTEVKVAECPSDAGDATVDPDGTSQTNGYAVMGNQLPADPSGMNLYGQAAGAGAPLTPTMTNTAVGTSNVYKIQGSSYAVAWFTYQNGVQGVFTPPPPISTGPMQASAAKPPASKIMAGDSPWPGDRKWGDRRHRWHSADKKNRQHNLLFADGHAEFFSFGDPDKMGPDNIEWVSGPSTPITSRVPIGNAATDVKPGRRFW